MIPMPQRNSVYEVIARASSKCLWLACAKLFEKVPIGDMATVISGGTPDTNNPNYWRGEVVWVTPKDLGRPRNIEISSSERHITAEAVNRSSAQVLPPGAVILSSRAPIGHLGIAAKSLATNQGCKNIICGPRLNNRFLFHLLRSKIEELNGLGRGNTFKEIPAQVVKGFFIPVPPLPIQAQIAAFMDVLYLRLAGGSTPLPPLPPPLEEQRRIVSRIEELAAKINAIRHLRADSVTAATRLATASSSETYAKLRRTYGLKRAEDLCDHITDGDHNTPHFTDEGVKFIFVGNVSSGRVHFSGCKHVTQEYYSALKPHRVPRPGDILYSAVGATLGVPAIVENAEAFCFQRHIAILKPKLDVVTSRYLWHMLRSQVVFEKAWGSTTGTAQPTIPLRAIRNLEVPAPPIAAQGQIVKELDNKLSQIESLRVLQLDSSAEVDALMPSILSKAFRGEL
jgi:type I restriction enzyme S subunit